MSNPTPFRFTTILWAGFLAGTLDIADALLGRDAFQGGLGTAALGLLLHFAIACSAATFYYLLSRSFGLLNRYFVVCGLVYGLGVYLFMNHIVLPLVFVNRSPLSGLALVNGVLADRKSTR